VRLVARNIPQTYECCECGKKADYFDIEDIEYYCEECYGDRSEIGSFFFGVCNSPRMGVCAYECYDDDYAFNPKKLIKV